MISIHNNFESVRLSRHISNRLGSLRMTFGRISTGLRVNSAGDDAAGLQIRDRLTSQIIEAQTEIKNITSEASLLQTAHGALQESQTALQRMRELAVSAANQTLSIDDRVALEQEFKALMGQIDVISEETTFNGIKILSSEASSLRLSLLESDEPSQNTTHELLRAVNTHELGRQARYDSAQRGVFLSALESGDLSINGTSIRGTTHYDDTVSYSYKAGSAISKAKVINAVSGFTGVRAIVDENVVKGRDTLGALDFGHDHWLKVNGVLFGGVELQVGDSDRALRDTINASRLQSGVYATTDAEGRLILSAEDGRNITVEYSDRSVREAIGILDPLNDPINVANVVDPAEFMSDGDIAQVSYTGAAAGFSASVVANPNDATDLSGSYSGERDLVDFVIEVVEGGAVGAATYRVKYEDFSQIPQGTRDLIEEDYEFNGVGAISEGDPSRLFDLGTSYREASTRQVKIAVKEEGNLLSNIATDRPLADLILYNVDTGAEDAIVTNVRLDPAQTYTDFFADYGISFKLAEPGQATLQNSNGSVNATSSLELELTSGPGYTHTPELRDWTGTIKTEFQIEVTQDGHGVTLNDSNEAPAQLEVRALIYRDGSATPTETEMMTLTLNESSGGGVTYNADGSYTLSFTDPGAGEVTLAFPTPSNTELFGGVTDPVWATSSGYDLSPTLDKTFNGAESLDYLIRFRTDGAFTGEVGDGPAADIFVNGVKVDSIGEVDDSYFNLLGSTGSWEGLRLQLSAPVIDSQTQSTTYTGNDVSFDVGTYNELNRTVVVEITEGGNISGADSELARFKYYYQDDPTNPLGVDQLAAFSGGLALTNADGLVIDGTAINTGNLLTQHSSSDAGSSLLSPVVSAYSSEKIGTLNATVVTTGSSVDLKNIQVGTVSDDNYSNGGTPNSFKDSVSVSGTMPFTGNTQFYAFFRDNVMYLTRGANPNDIDSISTYTSYGIDGSNTFNLGGGHQLTINYNAGQVDDDDSAWWWSSGGATTGMKLTLAPVVTQNLETEWSFEGSATPVAGPTVLDIQAKDGQSVNLGFGVSATLDTATAANGAVYTLEVTPQNLKAGDTFTATLESQVSAGDEITFTAEPETTALGSVWSVTGLAPKMAENSVETITYQHAYESPIYTLTDTLSYPPGTGAEGFAQLKISSIGNLKSGDEIRVKTRAFLGEVLSSGTYEETLYPTDYVLTVTQGGDLSNGESATLEWARTDGLTESFLEGGGQGSLTVSAAQLGAELYLEEGVSVTFNDLGQGAYLAQGDQILIPVGQRLEYSFAGGISLQSRQNIDLDYASDTVDSLMGRVLSASVADPSAPSVGLESGFLGRSDARSVGSLGLLTQRQINEAIETIDLALDQLNGSMSQVGAVMNRASHRIENLNQKALDLMLVRGRIVDADFARETAKMASEQISLMSAPLLAETSLRDAMTVLDLINQNNSGEE